MAVGEEKDTDSVQEQGEGLRGRKRQVTAKKLHDELCYFKSITRIIQIIKTDIDRYIDISVNCNWVDTQWQ